jgi:hypothetical protein
MIGDLLARQQQPRDLWSVPVAQQVGEKSRQAFDRSLPAEQRRESTQPIDLSHYGDIEVHASLPLTKGVPPVEGDDLCRR